MKGIKENKNKTLRCALIFMGPFPVGNVSSIRIMSYCKALAQQGVFVKILLIAPTAESAVNTLREGEINGVLFQHMTDITWKKPNTKLLTKILYYLYGLIKSIRYIKKDNINCLLSYHDQFVSNIFYGIITKCLSIPFILDRTEYPYSPSNTSKLIRIVKNVGLKQFNGIITITRELQNFFMKAANLPSSKVFLLPMTMDLDRYKGLKKELNNTKYIAVVFGTHNRDGLFDSIRAYHLYAKMTENPYKLILIGDFDELCKRHPICKDITNYIVANKLHQFINFKGLVPINEVPQLLLNAECLLTTPLDFVSGGFPTKLGEYLLSGVPVVSTSAGEIEKYAKSGEHLLLSAPGDLQDIAANILIIHKRKIDTEQLGSAGIALVHEHFNAEQYVNKLIKYLYGFRI